MVEDFVQQITKNVDPDSKLVKLPDVLKNMTGVDAAFEVVKSETMRPVFLEKKSEIISHICVIRVIFDCYGPIQQDKQGEGQILKMPEIDGCYKEKTLKAYDKMEDLLKILGEHDQVTVEVNVLKNPSLD